MVTSPVKWTARGLEALSVTEREDFTDPETPNLQFRVTPNGAKSWAYVYTRKSDRKKRRLTLGQFPAMGMADARAEAKRLAARLADGEDPAQGIADFKALETVNELLDRYLSNYAYPNKKTAKEDERIFNKDIRPHIGNQKAKLVTKQHILAILNAISDRGSGVAANRTQAAISKAFSWAADEGYLETNPAQGIKKRAKENPRERVFTNDEIKRFWNSLTDCPMGDSIQRVLRLALLTGQRIGEVCKAELKHVDFETLNWTIPSENTKNEQAHALPLSEAAAAIFKEAKDASTSSKYFFPSTLSRSGHLESHSVSTAMRRSRGDLGLTDDPANAHDLRRTIVTGMVAAGASEDIVARIINHKDGAKNSLVARVYNQHNYANERREALEKWAAHLAKVVTIEVA